VRGVPGSIQSIERAAAVLRLLGSTDRALGLSELAAALDLPRPTVHGIVRTLHDVGFVDQDPDTARYRLGEGWGRLHRGLDRHDLRAAAMNWADALAGGTGLAVVLAVAGRDAVEVVHHVFRPDGTPQQIRTGERLPWHATAPGKCLLAFAPVATPRGRDLDLQRFTGRTCTDLRLLREHLATARHRGWASDVGEYEPDAGGAAAPLRGGGGVVVGALGVTGPVDVLFGHGATLRPRIVEDLLAAAHAVGQAVGAATP